jgi:hypothetical protein
LGFEVLAPATVFFLYFFKEWSNHTIEETRYLYMWTLEDVAISLLCVALPLVVWICFEQFVRLWRSPFLTRISNHLFLLITAEIIFHVIDFCFYTNIGKQEWYPYGINGLRVLAYGLVGLSFCKNWTGLHRRVRQGCMIVSPGIAIVVVSALCYSRFPKRMDPVPEISTALAVKTGQDAAATPVYLFIFDEWSYRLSYEQDRLKPMFENLEALRKQSIMFTDAHSAGDYTMVSLPPFLFQTDRKVELRGGQTGFVDKETWVPSQECQSLFSVTADKGYQSVLIGFHLPYGSWLGDKVDICRTYPFVIDADDVYESCVNRFLFPLVSSKNPLGKTIYDRYYNRIYYDYYYGLHPKVQQDIESVVMHGSLKTFAVFHYMSPHMPFLFDSEGAPKPCSSKMYKPTIENYEDHLGYTDTLIGRFVGMLKERGTYDRSLLIITSDHSWRKDPERDWDKPNTHVPLFIKLPHQRTSAISRKRLELIELGKLIEEVLHNAGRTTDIVSRFKAEGKLSLSDRP